MTQKCQNRKEILTVTRLDCDAFGSKSFNRRHLWFALGSRLWYSSLSQEVIITWLITVQTRIFSRFAFKEKDCIWVYLIIIPISSWVFTAASCTFIPASLFFREFAFKARFAKVCLISTLAEFIILLHCAKLSPFAFR